jgi:hypothetical protein
MIHFDTLAINLTDIGKTYKLIPNSNIFGIS